MSLGSKEREVNCRANINQMNRIVSNNVRIISHRERGQWAVYYTLPQSFIITFSYSLI